MENLLNCKGRRFSARIGADKDIYYTEGIIQVERNRVWLLQNSHDGDVCKDKLGFEYSWALNDGSDLNYYDVYGFKLLDEEPKRDGTPRRESKGIGGIV